MTFKLSELAPAMAERIAAEEAHRESCTDEVCVRCHPDARARHHRAIMAGAERERAIAIALGHVPPCYAEAALDAPWLMAKVGQANINRASESLAAKSVVFAGPPGAGKTMLATAMYRAAISVEQSSRRICTYLWTDTMKLAKARANHPLGDGEAPEVAAAMNAHLLVLDELGMEDARHSSAVKEVLYERHAQNRCTWITTGTGSKEISDRYGGGIARRVFESAVIFKLGGAK